MSTIAVDAMGGDSAPQEIVKGAILAKEQGVDVILSGDKTLIETYLDGVSIPIIDYPEVISMTDNPARALRTKKNASILGALQLVKENKADGVFSAGATGGTLVGSISVLGKIKGVLRPAIAAVLPGLEGDTILLDAGSSLDVKPKVLLQYGAMGSKLAEIIFEIDNPKIGLLNNGEEESKGRDLEQSAYKLLKSSNLNFIGNIEGRDFANSKADVFVTDGFTGNVVLKTLEGTAKLQQNLISSALLDNLFKPLLIPVKKALKPVRDQLNPDKSGASYLLGVNGVVTIGHGSSNPEAVKNAILYTETAVKKDLISKFSSALSEL